MASQETKSEVDLCSSCAYAHTHTWIPHLYVHPQKHRCEHTQKNNVIK